MLYYNFINVEKYYKSNKILTTLEMNQKGVIVGNKLISYEEMFIYTDRNKNQLISYYDYRIGKNIIIGVLDEN